VKSRRLEKASAVTVEKRGKDSDAGKDFDRTEKRKNMVFRGFESRV